MFVSDENNTFLKGVENTDEILKNKKYAVTYRTFLFGCTGSNTKNSRDKELKITRMIKK
jgi:hypothetical protein